MARGSVETEPVYILKLDKKEIETLRILVGNFEKLNGIAFIDPDVASELHSVIHDLRFDKV